MRRCNLFRKEGNVTMLAEETAPGAWALIRGGNTVAEMKRSGNVWLLMSGADCTVFSRLTDLLTKIEGS